MSDLNSLRSEIARLKRDLSDPTVRTRVAQTQLAELERRLQAEEARELERERQARIRALQDQIAELEALGRAWHGLLDRVLAGVQAIMEADQRGLLPRSQNWGQWAANIRGYALEIKRRLGLLPTLKRKLEQLEVDNNGR